MRQSLYLAVATLFCALLTRGNCADGTSVRGALKENMILYTDMVLVNTSDSLHRLRQIPLSYYEFIYDSVRGRRHMGVLPADAARYFPESVDVLEKYTLPSREAGKAPTILSNFPVVDKNALFMHGLAAVQGLVKMYDNLAQAQEEAIARHSEAILAAEGKNEARKLEMLRLIESIERQMEQVGSKIDAEWSDHDADMNKFAKAELQLAQRARDLENFTANDEQDYMVSALAQEKAVLEYQQDLVKQRFASENEVAKAAAAASLKTKRDSLQRKRDEQERLELLRLENAEKMLQKRAALDKELLLKKAEVDQRKFEAELQAKAEAERANEDISIRKLKLKSKLERMRQKDAIQQLSSQVSAFIQQIITQPRQLAIILGIFLGFIATYYVVREILSVIREFIQTQLGRPSLVRETSYKRGIVPNWLGNLFSESREQSMQRIEDIFRNVILNIQDKEQVMQLALATRNTKRSGAPYRHILLHGPPGTGKTLIARRLAECSGMDYAIMSGGDVGPLGEDAVSQLHKLFNWAARSKKGLLLFIDEAEAFLGCREKSGGTGGSGENQHLRNALNALLYQTGAQSTNFMLILATNRPEDLDAAVLDRIDISLRIGLPGKQECFKLTSLYMDLHITQHAKKTQKTWLSSNRCRVDETILTEQFLSQIADKTLGFSGREISKLFIGCQCDMMLAPQCTLNEALVMRALSIKVKEHVEKTGGHKQIAVESATKSSSPLANASRPSSPVGKR